MAKYGFTTGSCSAAAAKGAAYMLLSGKIKNDISIITPSKITYHAALVDILRKENEVSCSVIKDGGDDPDVTTGAHINVRVSYAAEGSANSSQEDNGNNRVIIKGGKGVGQVTKPGLDQPVGNAAINSVPRRMIIKEVMEVMELMDYKGSLLVTISIKEGETLAAKTFNPRLGIEGGLSILGTSGVVEPMSSRAILDTIKAELSQKKALGNSYISVSPGNYGLDYMKRTYDFDLDKSVKCSNFIGDTLDMVGEFGFTGMLLTGHIGKLVKVAGGMMNTHSKYGDNRMEVICLCARINGAGDKSLEEISECVTAEEAATLLDKIGILDATMMTIMDKIMSNLNERVKGRFMIECMMYSNKHGVLAASKNAEKMLSEILKLSV